MNWEVYNDEIGSLGKKVTKYHTYRCNLAKAQWKAQPSGYTRFVVFSDGINLEDMLLPMLAGCEDVEAVFVEAFADTCYSQTFREQWNDACRRISLEEFDATDNENTAFVLLVDSRKHDPKWLEILQKCVEKTRNGKKNKILIAVLLPSMRAIPDGIEKLQEREYAFFLEKIVDGLDAAETFVMELEAGCRSGMGELGEGEMTYLRIDNLFGSTGSAFPAYELETMVRHAFDQGEVVITKQDQLYRLSCIYTRDAAMCVMAGLYYGKHGHVYNVSRYALTVADIKEQLQRLFPDRIALKTDGLTYSMSEIENHSLSALKFFHEHPCVAEWMKTFRSAFYACVCSWMELPFDVVSQLKCYEGKLQRLKSAEIDILQEIDRICRKHHIQYFLAGGSCLGAIRENKSIPWDDDLDIGMLREDLEKFRKVAPQELSDKYVYSSPLYDENCHYYFDKIRLSDTYFSTFYSNKFVLDDGVFVDIVVYDQTSPRKGARNRQIKRLHWMVSAINLRWHGYPVGKGKRRQLAKIILPIMKRIPFARYHKWYDKLATKYANIKDAEYVLDGGTHLTDGPFPREAISQVEYTEFDGMKNAPIPTGYDEYLSFLYSPNYRPAPPLSSRLGAHKIARLDLGKYLFTNQPSQTFRAVDIRGELFETEEER